MNETSDSAKKFSTFTNTVSQPVAIQAEKTTTVATGTVGHAGVVEYSRSATAMVSETYVVATKK